MKFLFFSKRNLSWCSSMALQRERNLPFAVSTSWVGTRENKETFLFFIIHRTLWKWKLVWANTKMDTLCQLCSNLSVYLTRNCLPLALTRLKKKKSYKKTKSTTLVSDNPENYVLCCYQIILLVQRVTFGKFDNAWRSNAPRFVFWQQMRIGYFWFFSLHWAPLMIESKSFIMNDAFKVEWEHSLPSRCGWESCKHGR